MPTYSYRCTECDNAFDIQQAFTDSSLTVCPVCGGKLRKVFGIVGVTFNGPGFYRTDSRSASDSKHGSKHHAKTDTVKSDSAKTDTAKTEAKSSSPAAKASSGSSSPASSHLASSGSKAGSAAAS